VRKDACHRYVVILLLLVVVLSIFETDQTTIKKVPWTGDNLEPGDILFVDIYTGWCFYGYWDHLAIYVGEQSCGGYHSPAVVEATYNGGVCLTPLWLFLERDEPAEVSVKRLRASSLSEGAIPQVVEYALAQVGKPFDFIFPAHKIGDRSLHCVELVWRAYKVAGVELDSNGGLLLYPDEIYYSSQLMPI